MEFDTSISQVRPRISWPLILTTGMAIFAMQFGAGNIVFALAAGQYAQDKTFFASAGLLLSGVIVPLLGLIAMTLYQGDYRSFMGRLGAVPGFLLTTLMLSLLGPFGAIPRCIALSYSSSKMYLPGISLPVFSIFCCGLIFLAAFRRTRILDVIGYIFTPLKICSLVFLIIYSLWTAGTLPVSSYDDVTTFMKGFKDGYLTMDLIGAFFICAVFLDGLRIHLSGNEEQQKRQISFYALAACCIGAVILGAVYAGFSYAAAYHSANLQGVSPENLVNQLAYVVLGSQGGIFVCFAVTVACMTTAIALSTVFAEFLQKDFSRNKLGYVPALCISLAITFVMSTLDFAGIIRVLMPLLQLCYPALITLCVINILHKIIGFNVVKIPVLIVFALTIYGYYLA